MTCDVCHEQVTDRREHRHERPEARYARWTAAEQRRQIRAALRVMGRKSLDSRHE